jgi:hypothetical protein
VSDPYSAIVLAAAELKIAAMPQYNAMMRALGDLEERLRADLVAADKDMVFTQQGKCQLAGQLFKKLDDCIKLREELKRRT